MSGGDKKLKQHGRVRGGRARRVFGVKSSGSSQDYSKSLLKPARAVLFSASVRRARWTKQPLAPARSTIVNRFVHTVDCTNLSYELMKDDVQSSLSDHDGDTHHVRVSPQIVDCSRHSSVHMMLNVSFGSSTNSSACAGQCMPACPIGDI